MAKYSITKDPGADNIFALSKDLNAISIQITKNPGLSTATFNKNSTTKVRITKLKSSLPELVPDPSFNDPAAWSFAGFGATVTGGQLRFINATIASSATVPVIVPTVGSEYEYSFIVSAYPSPLTARILFGGVEIYNKDGVGTFTGTITATETSGLIFIMTLAGQLYLDNISIKEAA